MGEEEEVVEAGVAGGAFVSADVASLDFGPAQECMGEVCRGK